MEENNINNQVILYKACIDIINTEEIDDMTFIGGFERGALWNQEILLEKATAWLNKSLDEFKIGNKKVEFRGKEKFLESFKKAIRL